MKLVRQFETNSEPETIRVGEELADLLPPDAVISLIGDLGAGKTTLTKGIVKGRQVATPDQVSSPTFTLIHEYGDPVTVRHIDLYRLQSEEEANRLGLEEIYDAAGLALVEWADKFVGLLPQRHFEIRILAGKGDHRTIQFLVPE